MPFPSRNGASFRRFAASSTHPVVIVGGGMSGAMTAYACAAAGLKVMLLEADRIGLGGSGRATGLLSGEACESYPRARSARTAGAPRARCSTRCRRRRASWPRPSSGSASAPVSTSAISFRVAAGRAVRQADPRARSRRARTPGLKASWTRAGGDRAAGGDRIRPAAMRLPDGGFADPFKLTLGFLSAAIKRGVKVYEHSRVKKITFTRKTATAYLDGGAITTTNLVICIGEPTSLFKPLKRHLRHEDRYAVLTEPLSAAVRAELGQRTRAADATPRRRAHHLWFTADHRALFAGADQKRPPDRLRDKTLVQRTGQLMYELSRLYPAISGAAPAYGWDVPLAHPVDGVLVCRLASQLSVPSLRVRHVARSGPRVSREPHHPAQHPGPAGEGREYFSFARNL